MIVVQRELSMEKRYYLPLVTAPEPRQDLDMHQYHKLAYVIDWRPFTNAETNAELLDRPWADVWVNKSRAVCMLFDVAFLSLCWFLFLLPF